MASFPNTKQGLKDWKAFQKTIDPRKVTKQANATVKKLKKLKWL